MSTSDHQMAQDVSESSFIPRRRDSSFYLVSLLVVVPLWSVTPVSWLYVIYVLKSGTLWDSTWNGRPLIIIAFCEVIFSIYHHIVAGRISRSSIMPPGDTVELQTALKRVLQAGLVSLSEDDLDEEMLNVYRSGSPHEIIERLEHDDPRAVDFRNYLRTWFGKIPWSSLRTEHIYAWLFWSIFNAPLPPLHTLSRPHRAILDESLELIEKRAGSVIPKGSCMNVKPLLLTLDPINIVSRPLSWYVLLKIGNVILREVYKMKHGMKHVSHRGLEYLIRIPSSYSIAAGPTPSVFIHGLGLGLLQYERLLSHLVEELPDHPFLILIQPHISQDIFHRNHLKPMGRYETVERLSELLQELGWVGSDDKDRKGVTFISHSNGSYTHAWMLKSYPAMIARSCFIDPVTFCVWEGDVCYNWVYKPCSNGLEVLMRYFVGTELGVANFIQRHFDWSSNSLWYEDVPNARDPRRSMFILGGKDAIVEAERVKRYLRSHGVNKSLWFDPEGRHGQALLKGGKGLAKVMQWLKDAPAP